MTKELQDAIRHIKTRADAWAVKEIVDALKQEPCDDAISRESIHRKLALIMNDHPLEGYEDEQLLLWAVEDEPSVQPSRKGHWIQIDYQRGKFECSECHTQGYVDTCMYEPKWNFCPNCGADMRGKE